MQKDGGDMQLSGANVVVTGGANGIGRALCRAFAQAGARRIDVVDLDLERAQEVADAIGGRAHRIDVASPAAVDGLVREVERDGGPIDLFVSNAGLLVVGGPEVPVADWQRLWDVNVMAHVHAANAVLPSMLARGRGYLLNTCSAAGLLTQIGSAPYAVTKHAAVAFSEWLAITYGDRGIRVSALCPQAVRTNMAIAFGDGDGGVAGIDGMIEPEALAAVVVEGLADERFLILPHPVVEKYYQRKGQDLERWLAGMRKLQRQFGGTPG